MVVYRNANSESGLSLGDETHHEKIFLNRGDNNIRGHLPDGEQCTGY